jgi:hypothetical protein
MRRLIVVATAICGCGLFPDMSVLTGNDAGPPADATIDTGVDAAPDVKLDTGADAPPQDAAPDVADASDSGTCSCTNLVSAYTFSSSVSLGKDYVGNNNMTTVKGSPGQSTVTPPGFSGHSLQLDGASTVCIDTSYTFDSTSDHTLCWWSQPSVLADSTNQFAQTCSYDTWTQSSGVDYLWRINNCNSGTPANLAVSNVYAVGKWVQICQTYKKATLTRTVVIDGNTSGKHVLVDTVPIVENTSSWCIGSYGSGGWWTGLIYRPMWFDRVLTDTEIQAVAAKGCCLP